MIKWNLIALLAFIFPLPAFSFSVSLVGVEDYSTPAQSTTRFSSEAGRIGGGVLLESRLIPRIGWEIGALYAQRKYENLANSREYTKNLLEVPLLIRIHLLSTFTFGAGVYYGVYRNNIAEYNTYTKTNSSYPYERAQQSRTDYGFVTSIGLYYPLIPFVKLMLDGRYTMGVKNNDLVPNDIYLKYNDFQVLAGLRVGF